MAKFLVRRGANPSQCLKPNREYGVVLFLPDIGTLTRVNLQRVARADRKSGTENPVDFQNKIHKITPRANFRL